MPCISVFEILREIKNSEKTKGIAVLMLSALNSELDKVKGLDCGADDYITKPYNPTLLLLKLEAVFRRIQPETPQEEVTWGGITLNLLRGTMTHEGEERVLSKNEFSIFYYLVKNQ